VFGESMVLSRLSRDVCVLGFPQVGPPFHETGHLYGFAPLEFLQVLKGIRPFLKW